MIKMCLNLINSEFRSINEVETLLNNKIMNITENDIIAMKDNRKLIEKNLKKANEVNDIIRLQ